MVFLHFLKAFHQVCNSFHQTNLSLACFGSTFQHMILNKGKRLSAKAGQDINGKIFRTFYGLLFLWSVIFSNKSSQAGQGIANTGIWGSSLTWTFGGVSRLPTCGDTLTIPLGKIVTVNSQEDYTSCGQKMFISIAGTLQFMNGYKLDMPCSSSVELRSGGVLKKATAGGGNSTFLKICNCTSWTAADGSVFGPKTLNCSLLPIELLSFSADNVEEGIVLKWITASETNNQNFTCERSSTGIDFFPIGNVKGAGSSTELNEYSFTDNMPLEGRAYYRLRQTDYDGATTHLDIIAISFKRNSRLNIVNTYLDENGLLNVAYKNNLSNVLVKLYNITGKEVFTQDFRSTEVLNKIILKTSKLTQGIYVLMLMNSEKSIQKKIFIGQ